ncbi:helix-turn-helix domain-containing protein [Lacticaseibacillus camelliae]
MVGYADPNYFSSVFKKHFGRSPMQYRGGLAKVSSSK